MNDTSAAVTLPLVYTIVRRTLSVDVDVHDVVRATMARVAQEAGGARFRSGVVAVTVDQIREHQRRRRWPVGVPEQDRSVVEIEFVDRPLNALAAARQRGEVARAARWLGDDERELLALWSVERGGHIKPADVVGALGQDGRHVAVRVSRVKRRLEAARLLLRALCATPRCRGLVMAGNHGHGRTPLLRHVAGCETCRRTADDLVPVEALFTGAALLPVPDDYAALMLSGARATVGASEQTVEIRRPIRGGVWRVSRLSGPYRRLARLVTAKPLLTAVGAGAALVAVVVATVPTGASPPLAASVRTSLSASPTATESSPAMTSGPAAVSLVPASSEATTTTAVPTTTTTATTTATTTTTRPAPTTTKAPVTGQSAEAARVVVLVNEARAAAGCAPLRVDDRLTRAAQAHSTDMAERGYFSHTSPDGVDPSERMRAAGFDGSFVAENIAAGQSTPEAVMGSWMNSPGHRGNILDCGLSAIGVGLDKRGWRWTQNFGGW